ncbi:MAG: AraC family transcriptional regulator [Kofleriaceae bacterium]
MPAVATALPGLRVSQWVTNGLYSAIKETHAIARITYGRSEYALRGKTWTTTPHALLFRQPGDFHRDLAREGKSLAQVLSFDRSLFASLPIRELVPQLAPDDPRGAVFHRLHDAVAANEDRLALEVATTEAIAQLGRLVDPTPPSRPVRRALELIHERYADPLTLDEIAAAAELDRFRLCRAFRAHVGLSPHAYLTRMRIIRAKQLLVSGMPAGEVAHAVGLYDQSQLNRHFKKLVGTTPGKYAT